MVSRILKKPLEHRKSFFLLGPRGTGKTYWLKNNLKNAVYIDLLNTEIYMKLLSNPHGLVDFIPPDYSGWIIIDEVQKIPELLNEVHRLIESESHTFILTGSSARNLRKKGVNLLAGRALIYHMHPLVVQEMASSFNIVQALSYGMLPALLTEPDAKAYLKSYVTAYLREEVMQEGLTRNLAAFNRFLEIASFSQGQIINMSAIARESHINQKNVSNYFDILEDLLLGFRIPIFDKRAKRQTVQHPKFYYFDVGIYRTLRPHYFLDTSTEIEGAALETLFIQSVRAINDYYAYDYQIFYWRTVTGIEVDFILYGPLGFLAFEIKRSKTISRFDCKGLISFQKDYPEVKLYLVYGGEQTYYMNEVKVLSITEVLLNLPHLLSGQGEENKKV